MATYQPRKGSNVSQYIANLNTMPSAHDVATQQEEQNFNIDEELAQFTNTDFFDYDPADFLDQSIPDLNPAQGEHARSDNASTNDKIGAKGMHFVTGDFPFPDLNPFLPTTPPTTAIASPLQPPPYPTPLYNAHPASPNFNLTTSYPGHQPHQSSGSRSTSPTTQDLSAAANNETPAARLAAEEDKRRRNTAASARFRVKKKQREQALEQTAKDLENKTLALEQRIRQLETENEWLRVLVVEKNGGEKADLKVRWERVGGVEGGGERRGEKGKKGVGTEEKGEGEA